MLWCLLVFTVHRTSISAVFLPHAFVYDYSALVDFISFSSFVFFLHFGLVCSFCTFQCRFVHVALFSPSVCYSVKLTYLVDITWLSLCGMVGVQMFLLCIMMDNCVFTVCS